MGLLRSNPDYRALWLGQLVSFFGDWFKTIALYEVVKELTGTPDSPSGSATALALVLVFKTLPIFLMTPIAGPLGDRFDRKWIMIAADIARATVAVAIIGAYWAGSLPAVFAMVFVGTSFAGLFIPARTASYPQLCNERELPVALALSAGTWSVMLAFGAAAGGLVTAFAGIEAALLLDGATFLLSAYFLWGLPAIPPTESDSQVDAGFAEGVRYLRQRPYLASVLTLKSAIGLAAGVLVAIPAYGNGLFPVTVGPMFIGWLYFGRGLGALTGSLAVRRLTGDSPRVMRRTIPLGFALAAGAYTVLGQAPNIWVAGLCFFVGGVGTGIVWVFASNLGQIASDREYRARIFSLEWAGMMVLTSGISFAAGWGVDHTALTYQMLCTGTGLVLVVPMFAWMGALVVLRPEGTGKVDLSPQLDDSPHR